MRTYEIKYSNGRVDIGFGSYDEAITAFAAEHEEGVLGHDGDLSSGGDRTLCWASAEEADGDDGARAVASIVAIEI